MLAPLLFLAVAAATQLTIDRHHVTARFDPRTSLGATIDAQAEDQTAKVLTKTNVEAILSAGFHPLSYRLATELAGEAWHWNPRGTWSDPARGEGYWTSSDESPEPINVSYGYRLPRRGNTLDQVRNNGYSRIVDGDSATFWKSNPYEGDRPQWLFADLGTSLRPDTIAITWAEPFAIDYDVQYWTGNDPINEPAEGDWITFPHGSVHNGRGGEVTLPLGDAPVTIRYVRVWMTRSSHTCHADVSPCADPRDSIGFAVAELSIRRGSVDYTRHGMSKETQSIIWVSSTDPWHRANDIDRSIEQPGLDLLFASGLTRGLPMLTPVALLYGTPEDAAAEVRFLRKRKYAVTRIEMGEEPDGQNTSPEDYGTLYLRWAETLHAVDPSLHLGGPAFQSTRDRIDYWPDDRGRTAWMGRFVDLLRERGRLDDFSFFSFEWYPFDDVCGNVQSQLAEGPQLLRRVLEQWRGEGVPRTIPWLATEYGWSSYAAEAEVDLPGALFNAEFVADFLSAGGGGAYVYGLEPNLVFRRPGPCAQYGHLLLFLGDEEHRIVAPLATYHGARLLMRDWLAAAGIHELHPVRGTSALLRAWAVRRPDGTWSLLVINKDAKHARTIRVAGWRDLDVRQFSRREYAWHANGAKGKPLRSKPPRHVHARDSLEIPPYSMTVIER